MIICRHMPAPHWFFPRLSYKTADENKLITTDERDSFEDSFFLILILSTSSNLLLRELQNIAES